MAFVIFVIFSIKASRGYTSGKSIRSSELMPDRTKLKVGDRIRLLRVPQGDLEQRERELRKGLELAGWTADTIERIIAQDPVVSISSIDEYGQPWFEYELKTASGEFEIHSLAILEDDSWQVEQACE